MGNASKMLHDGVYAQNEHHQFFGLWRAKIVGIHLWKTQVGSSYYKTYF